MTRFPLPAICALILAFSLLPATPADAARHHHARHRAVKPAPEPQEEVIVVTGMTPVAQPGSLKAAWTQYGPDGVVEARAVVKGKACPRIAVDLRQTIMTIRAASDDQFLTLCAAAVPTGSKQAAIVFPHYHAPMPSPEAGFAALLKWVEEETGIPAPAADAPDFERRSWLEKIRETQRFDLVPLPLPTPDPQRILVIGDTGCRIKDKLLQDCSDPPQWPFARISAEAARLKPDLVIHVGDYLYRESACPADFKGCTGTPFGDNWPTWDADFFAPAKPLLAAAPWIIVRGNHEDCEREGAGFLRLLGPAAFDPAKPCSPHVPPYTVPLGGLNAVVMDNADAPETSVVEALVPVYRKEFAALAESKAPTWLLLHRPVWGAISGPLGMPIGGNQTMIAGLGQSGIAAPVELMLAGHIHTFQTMNFAPAPHVPPQLVVGFSGDMLDETPDSLRGTVFQGDSAVRVTDGLSVGGFGFAMMTRDGDGWRIDVHDWQGRIERQCVFRAGRLGCPKRR